MSIRIVGLRETCTGRGAADRTLCASGHFAPAVPHGIMGVRLAVAPWRSGYAEVCKTFHIGSIPVGASTLTTVTNGSLLAIMGAGCGRVLEW